MGSSSKEEGGNKEVRVEGKKRVKEKRLRKCVGELGESVGDVESGSVWVGDEVGEAEEADRTVLLGPEGEGSPVALRALDYSWFLIERARDVRFL